MKRTTIAAIVSSRWTWPAVLLAIIAFFTGWNLWAIITDQQITLGQDCFLFPALRVAGDMELEGASPARLFVWRAKGPVTPVLALLLSYLVGVVPLAGRLLSVLAHAALQAQCFAMGRRLTGQISAGLWSAFFCGATPMLFGWARLEYPEMVLAVLAMEAIRLVLRDDLDRPGPAAGLGVLFALGIMTKVGFVAFMVVPGLWLLVRHLRGWRPRSLLSLGLTLGAMALAAGPWIAVNFQGIFQNLIGSTTTANLTAMDKVEDYLKLTGVLPLLLAAGAAWVWLWLGKGCRRPDLGLLGLYVGVSLLLFMGLFDSWSRYIVPIFPAVAVLVGCGVVKLGGRLPLPASLAGGALLAGAHLTWFVWLNLFFVVDAQPRRELTAGMMCPDQRPYQAYPQAARRLLSHAASPALLLFDQPETRGRVESVDMHQLVWWFNGLKLNFSHQMAVEGALAAGRPVGVLLVRGSGNPDPIPKLSLNWLGGQSDEVHMPRTIKEEQRSTLAWLGKQDRQLVFSQADPGDITYEVYIVSPKKEGANQRKLRGQSSPH